MGTNTPVASRHLEKYYFIASSSGLMFCDSFTPVGRLPTGAEHTYPVLLA